MFTLLSIEPLYQLPIYFLLFGIALLTISYFCHIVPKYQRIITFSIILITLLLVIILLLDTLYIDVFESIDANSSPLSNSNIQRLFTIDSYGLIYASLILIVSLIAILLIYRSIKLPTRQQIAIDIAILFAVIGSILVIFSSHLMAFYLSLEIISLPLLFLLTFNGSNYFSLNKIVHTWTISLVGSALFLLGVGLYYATNHELTFSGISLNLATNDQSPPLSMIGLSFMFLSILFKLGLAPIQSRFINQIRALSYPIALFLLAVINVAIFCCLSRLFLISTIVNNETIKIIIIIVASCSIVFGNIGALYQKDMNPILGYLYISFFGYLLIPFIAMQYNIYAIETIHICLFGYILAFIVIYSILTIESTIQQKKLRLDDLAGLVKKRRLNSIMLIIALFSIANIPLTIGFIGYFFLMLTAVTANLWVFIALFVLSTITGLYLCLKLIVTLFRKPTNLDNQNHLLAENNSFLSHYKINEIIAFIAMFAIIFFGFFPKWLLNIASLSTI